MGLKLGRTTAIVLLWLASLVIAYTLGWHTSPTTMQDGAAAALISPPESHADLQLPSSTTHLLADQRNANRAPSDAEQLALLIQGNRLFAAIEVLKTMINGTPNDMSLRFKLAELLARTSQQRAAVAELLAVRSLSLESSDFATARQRIDQIIAAAHEQFRKTNQPNAAKAFFEDMQVLEPSYDRHRWYLAQWLITLDEHPAAQRLIDETGMVGVTEEEKNQVQQQLAAISSTLEVRRDAGSMITEILATTPHNIMRLSMLLDTGATHTAISLDKLRELGAKRTPHMVTVQTANGTVQLPIYEVDQFDAGPLTLNNLAVIALTQALPQADGLLGLDVLDQLPTPIVEHR